MTEDQDNAGEVVAGAVRVALTAAGQLAEQAARRREADLREAERESADRVATLRSQLAAERELALRSVHQVVQRGGAATVEEVVRAWEQARSWDDPTMGMERAQLEERIRERFGVDAASPAVQRSSGEQATATVLAARDVALQAGDGHLRGATRDQETREQIGLDHADGGSEAVAARDLAAQSHPTPPGQAARAPQVTPAGRPRGRRRNPTVEVQTPGR